MSGHINTKEEQMFPKIWKLLTPFHRQFYLLILMAVFYEAGGIVVSYTIPLIVQLFTFQVQLIIWFLVVICMLSFNEGYTRLDNQFDWHVIAKLWHPIYKKLKLDAVAKFLRLPLIWQQCHNSGILIGQVCDGIWKTLDIVSMTVWEFMPTLVQTVLSLIPMIFYSPLVAGLSVLTFVLFALITLRGEKVKASLRKLRQDEYEKDWNYSVSSVQAIETVITFGLAGYMMDKLTGVQDTIINLAQKEHRLGVFVYNRWRIRLLTTMRLAIYALWVFQLFSGTMTIPSLIFLSVLMERLFSSFWRFARLADRVYGNSEAVMRLLNLLDEPEPVETGTQSVDIAGPVEIVFDEVCLAYGDEYTEKSGALHRLSINFQAGQVTALVGPSGAGKSTVAAALMRLYEIQHGNITVAGLSIRDWDKGKLLQLIAHVPQGDKVYLWDETIEYNIAIARPGCTHEEVVEAAKQAGIHDFIISRKAGYETIIGERGVRLSGGQKQRIALARAILRGSPIIVLDEPTSAIDSLTEQLIQANLKKMLSGKTAIIIAHRLSTIKDADKIVVMEDGRKVDEGTHHELISRDGLYAKMVALQTELER